MIECPNCGSDNVTHSHRRGIERLARYVYPRVPFRCKECWTRFWKFQSPLGGGFARIVALAILLMFTLTAGWYFFLRQNQDPPSSLQQKSRPRGGLVKKASETPAKRTVPTLRKQAVPPSAPIRKPGGASAASEKKRKEAAGVKISGLNAKKTAGPGQKGGQMSAAAAHKKKPSLKGTVPLPGKKTSPGQASQQIRRSGQTLKALRPQSLENGFRLTLLADGPIEKYKTMSLEEPPPKFVIDLAGKWDYSGPYSTNVRSEMVRRIRVGRHPDFIRIVMDLKGSKVLIPVIEESATGLSMTIKK